MIYSIVISVLFIASLYLNYYLYSELKVAEAGIAALQASIPQPAAALKAV